MKAFKLFVRGAAKAIGGVAGFAFLVAPVTNFGGWALMGGAALVGLACAAAYSWAEPDTDSQEAKN